MALTERQYQRKLIDKLERMFPGCLIIKNPPADRQGIPDLTILYFERWAMLEVKLDDNSPIQPNQEYYVEKARGMSFAAFVNPNNEEEVLYELQLALGSGR
jgi:hypothetical protein